MQVLIQCRRGEVFRTRTFDVLTISGDRPLESSKVDSPAVVLGGLGWVAGERYHPSGTGSSLWLTPGLPGSHDLRAAKAHLPERGRQCPSSCSKFPRSGLAAPSIAQF